MPAWLIALLPAFVSLIEQLLSQAQASNAAQDHPKTAEVLGVINQVTAIVAPHVISNITKQPIQATIGGGQGAPITPPQG